MGTCDSCGGRNKHGDWCEFYGSDTGLELYDNEDAFLEPEPEEEIGDASTK